MSEISPIIRGNAALSTTAARGNGAQPTAPPKAREGDQVEFSAAAQLLSRLGELPEVRQDLVDRVRREIDAGTYETTERIDGAIDSLIDDLS